ncbi:MAG: TRAP transporter large permease [Thermodesulfobacteriota bacterium]|nr:TRAP transporter large permease [Thermodesulfobacteriota bacterium]
MEYSLVIGIGLIIVAFSTGAPMFAAMTLGTTVLFISYAQLPGLSMAQQAISSISSFTLVAIPLFILLGNIMARSGAAAALFDLVRVFLGHLRAGLGMVTVWVAALFGTMCGSGVATAVAVSSIVVPEMTKSGYKREECAAICGASGPLGLLIPPSVGAIILAEILEVPVGKVFAAGVFPGILTAALLSIVCYIKNRNNLDIKIEREHTWKERRVAIWRSLPTLLIPMSLFGVIYGGIATPTEAAGTSCVIALIVGFLFYGKIKWKDMKDIARSSLISTTSIYCIVFGAVIFGRSLAYMEIPQNIAMLTMELALSPLTFMFFFLVIFFLLGMIFDAFALMYVCLPPLVSTFSHFGFDPVFIAILFIQIVIVGQLTPPVCITLYAAASGAGAQSSSTIRAALPYLIAAIISCILVLILPRIALFLPGLLK